VHRITHKRMGSGGLNLHFCQGNHMVDKLVAEGLVPQVWRRRFPYLKMFHAHMVPASLIAITIQDGRRHIAGQLFIDSRVDWLMLRRWSRGVASSRCQPQQQAPFNQCTSTQTSTLKLWRSEPRLFVTDEVDWISSRHRSSTSYALVLEVEYLF